MADPIVLVTDATHFVGPELCERLIEEGARVIAADADFNNTGITQSFVGPRPKVETVAQTSAEETIAAAKAKLGDLDVLVIPAALPAPRTPAETLNAGTTRPYFEKLAIEPLAMVAAALSTCAVKRIVFATSSGPIGGIPGFAAYAAARAAINGAVRSLALELAPKGISVNAVAPNFIQTETYYPKALLEDPAKREKLYGRIPLGRLGDASEAAEAIAFFALGNSGFVTGQVLNISGGWS